VCRASASFTKKEKEKKFSQPAHKPTILPRLKYEKEKKNVPGRRLEIAPTPFACTGHQGSPDEPKRFFFPFFPN
jgi:hypothetical protein